jgi:hypothetical protein
MNASLVATKIRLRKTYLGVAGIHGFGIDRSNQAIRVYVTPGQSDALSNVLEGLKNAAAPFALLIVEEQLPQIKTSDAVQDGSASGKKRQ